MFLADHESRWHLSSFGMRFATLKPAHLFFVCSFLPLAATLAQQARSLPVAFFRHQETEISGTYRGHAPASDAAHREFTLELFADGSASLTTLYVGKDKATERGRWQQTGNEVELTFDAMGSNQPPRPITFHHRDHELSPLHWDASEWGRPGPPTLHWSAPKASAAERSRQGGL